MEIYTEMISHVLEPVGFELHPFKICWYNEIVDSIFRLPYPDDTLAYCLISTPSMFDKAFLPYVETLREKDVIENRDPIDSCVAEQLKAAKNVLAQETEVDLIQDYEMHPVTRRPKLLVQTAGHVSGAAYYYRRKDVCKDPWPLKKSIYGVSIHPKFGGWFAFRGAIIMKDVTCPDLRPSQPLKLLNTDEEVIDLLDRFNGQWKDNTFRDVIPVQEAYSQEQIRYWATAPSKRFALLGLEDKLPKTSALQDLHEMLFDV